MFGNIRLLLSNRYLDVADAAVTLRQDLAAVLEGLEAAWLFFGGVVRRLVVDNLPPAVARYIRSRRLYVQGAGGR